LGETTTVNDVLKEGILKTKFYISNIAFVEKFHCIVFECLFRFLLLSSINCCAQQVDTTVIFWCKNHSLE